MSEQMAGQVIAIVYPVGVLICVILVLVAWAKG